jgi:hypothetical protein
LNFLWTSLRLLVQKKLVLRENSNRSYWSLAFPSSSCVFFADEDDPLNYTKTIKSTKEKKDKHNGRVSDSII